VTREMRPATSKSPPFVGDAMNQRRLNILSWLSLGFGVVLYLVGVTGLLWPATPPTDVGLLASSLVFVLFGVIGLRLAKIVHSSPPAPRY
jgi:uncharacterized membrane protein YiaA